MPVYEYAAKDPETACDYCSDSFEIDQRISEPPLKACPKCGKPVKKIISLFSVSTAQSPKSMLSDKNLKRHGFTKLVNEGEGKFRKI